MKKLLSLLLALLMLLSIAACGGSKNAETDTEDAATAQAEEVPEEETPTEEAQEESAVTYGQLTGIPAPEGWVISDRSAGNYLIYVEVTEDFEESEYWCPYLQFGFDDYKSPDEVLADRQEMFDDDGLTYQTEDVTIAGIDFHKIVPDLGEIMLYGERDGMTLIITHGKNLDETAPAVIDIIENIHILPAA